MSSQEHPLKSTAIWKRLGKREDLRSAVLGLRENARVLGEQIARVMPGYTDHSLIHMDSLASVLQHVLTSEEVKKFTPSEAFILISSFYIHDIGMALASTEAGREQIEESSAYQVAMETIQDSMGKVDDNVRQAALTIAARQLHATKAVTMVSRPVPGLDRFLLESTELRENWANHIGEVSASHHWPLSTVDERLGRRGRIPSPIGDEMDLGFLACVLRVTDYAHINQQRAPILRRLLSDIGENENLLHWLAQEAITGPIRQEKRLVFASTRPIGNVDAWWLFYDMASGLDSEVTQVSEYLSSRTVSSGRFSLEGVKGVRTPQQFAGLVQPDGFEPVDARFRPDSVERLIDILGGKTLYGRDRFAPVRELLQNARDAVHLKRAILQESHDYSGAVSVVIDGTTDSWVLRVADDGIGMNQEVATNFLLGVAADFWSSSYYRANFPGVREKGFQPAGKFGIGFLSVFMLGKSIQVESEGLSSKRVVLELNGLGARGALRVMDRKGSSGTCITVNGRKEQPWLFEHLDDLVRARAPMVDFPVTVKTPSRETSIEAGWWKTTDQGALYDFVGAWEAAVFGGQGSASDDERSRHLFGLRWYRQKATVFADLPENMRWLGKQPEAVSENYRVMDVPGMETLILCSHGIAVGAVRMKGICGVMELGASRLDAARAQFLDWNQARAMEHLVEALRPEILTGLGRLSKSRSLPGRHKFLARVAAVYGTGLLSQSNLPWITLVEPPGSSRLVTGEELISLLGKAEHVLVGYGVGPWSIYETGRNRFQEIPEHALVIPVSSADSTHFGSYHEDEPVEGPLREHFQVADRFSGPGDLDDAVLLVALLSTIAEAWGTDVEGLAKQRWIRNKSDNICGLLRRVESRV